MKKIKDFLETPEEKALTYNFASEGEEADWSTLAKAVYKELFDFFANVPFYEKVFNREDIGALKGDTAITWRTVIINNYYHESQNYNKPVPKNGEKYNNSYKYLKDSKKTEIKNILSKYAPFDGPTEFIDENGFLQITNHYTLGNLVLCPAKRNGINPSRASSLNDCYDKFLLILKDFYLIIDNDRELEMFAKENSLNKAIVEQKKYFEYFKDFNGFVDENLLQDFTDGYDDQGNYNIKDLSDAETFEDYVKASVSVINARSKRMWDKLQENNSK